MSNKTEEDEARCKSLWEMRISDPAGFQALSPSERIATANWAASKGIADALPAAPRFKPDPELDRLLEFRKRDPKAFQALPPSKRITAGRYEEAKNAHARARHVNENL